MATLNFEAVSIGQRAFVAGLAENAGDYARCCEVLDAETGQLQLGSLAAGGLATEVNTSTTAVSAANMATKIATINKQAYVLKHTVPWAELTSDFALQQAGTKMANAAAMNINKQFFDGLEGLFTSAHPAAGTGIGEVGSGKYFLDTGLAYLQGESGSGTQDNLLTSAFSESALDTAIQRLQNYKDQRALPLNMGLNGNLCLVVGPKNRKTALEVVTSNLSGADMQRNTLGPLVADVISFPFTTDEDDWFLMDRSQSACGIWIKEAPTLSMTMSDDGIFVHIVAKWVSAFYTRPYEYGIIGSNVA
jgi:hypothetical protein